MLGVSLPMIAGLAKPPTKASAGDEDAVAQRDADGEGRERAAAAPPAATLEIMS